MHKNNFFLLWMIFVVINSNSMELFVKLPADLKTMLALYATVQDVGRLAQTSTHMKDFDPAKIITNLGVDFNKIGSNYHRCTYALSRLAVYDNRLFHDLYSFDFKIRDQYVMQLYSVKNITNNIGPLCASCRMLIYKDYFKDFAEVEQRIREQLKDAILNKNNDDMSIILSSKKYNIFELFDKNIVEKAFQAMCELNTGSCDKLLQLLPEENGKHKNKAVQYICKYDNMDILLMLFNKGYLQKNEEYGNKCSLLHYAVLSQSTQLIQKLRDQDAALHVFNMWGKEPLDYAHAFRSKFKIKANNTLPWINESELLLNNWCQATCKKKHSDEYVWLSFNQKEMNWLKRSFDCLLDEKKMLGRSNRVRELLQKTI